MFHSFHNTHQIHKQAHFSASTTFNNFMAHFWGLSLSSQEIHPPTKSTRTLIKGKTFSRSIFQIKIPFAHADQGSYFMQWIMLRGILWEVIAIWCTMKIWQDHLVSISWQVFPKKVQLCNVAQWPVLCRISSFHYSHNPQMYKENLYVTSGNVLPSSQSCKIFQWTLVT